MQNGISFDPQKFSALTSVWKLVYLSETDSTNAQAKQAINQGTAESGSIYLADSQSAGVGRRGSAWSGGESENLLFSLVLETGISAKHISRLALSTGIAIALTLGEDLEVQVKWPNDVYATGKKLAGILVEHVDDFTIIGVGLNVNQQSFQTDLAATSIHLETGHPVEREALLAKLADQILKWGSLCVVNFDTLREGFEKLDYLQGHTIVFQSGADSAQGIARGINEQGELLVETNGEISAYCSAEKIKIIAS